MKMCGSSELSKFVILGDQQGPAEVLESVFIVTHKGSFVEYRAKQITPQSVAQKLNLVLGCPRLTRRQDHGYPRPRH